MNLFNGKSIIKKALAWTYLTIFVLLFAYILLLARYPAFIFLVVVSSMLTVVAFRTIRK